jgi:hypothetical protein
MMFWILYPWYIKLTIHGILSPLSIAYRSWYFDPPTHGITKPLPSLDLRYNDENWDYESTTHGIWNLLPMVFQTP